MQASLIRKPWQATRPTPPTGRNLHNIEKPQTARIQKGHPKHSNLNKMKSQRNTQQVKEQDKCPPNQIKEEEMSLHEKEFRIMIAKMIQNLNTTMHFFHHPKVHRRETHLDHPSIPVPCSNLKASVFLRPSSSWDSAGEGELRHVVGIRVEIPGSDFTREELLLFQVNFYADMFRNSLSADIRARAW